MLSARKEWTKALGALTQTGNIDFSYPLARFLRLYVEEYFVPNSKPGWAGTVWWTTPLSNVKNP